MSGLQGAYRGVDAGTLSQQLIESGLSEVHSAGFAAVWSEKAATFVAQLRDRALGTPHVRIPLSETDFQSQFLRCPSVLCFNRL
jgi:hypothetical protein